MVAGFVELPDDGGDDFSPAGKEGGVWRRTIVFDELMKPWQSMIGNQREHVVFDVVVHVPVEETIDDVGVEGPAVESVIEDVLGHAGVLGESVDKHEPRSKKMREADEHQGEDAGTGDAESDDARVDDKVDAGLEKELWEF